MTTRRVMSNYRNSETAAEASVADPTARFVARWTRWVLAPLALVGVVIAAPYFLTHGFLAVGLALERGFALVCHQRPERSFWMFGGTVAVCSRCLGIYLGATAGLLLRSSRVMAVRLLMAAAALNLLDAASELAGLHGNWLGVRCALGFLMGAAGALLVSSSAPNRQIGTEELAAGNRKALGQGFSRLRRSRLVYRVLSRQPTS